MMHWFGPAPFGPACVPDAHIPAPTELSCIWCDRRILPNDRGIVLYQKGCPNGCEEHAVHLPCMLRMIRGEH